MADIMAALPSQGYTRCENADLFVEIVAATRIAHAAGRITTMIRLYYSLAHSLLHALTSPFSFRQHFLTASRCVRCACVCSRSRARVYISSCI